MVLQLAGDAVIRATAPAATRADWYPWVISMVPMYACAMPLSWLLFRRVQAEPPKKQRLSFPILLGLLSICFALTYAGSFIGSIVNAILSMLTGREAVNDLAVMTTQAPLWVNLLFVGVAAPVLEELFYRKLLIDRWRRYGDLPAILLSGVAFGLIHGNFNQFFYATVLGCLFGYVYLRTGDIRYTVALHMSINLVGGVYSPEMLKRLDLDLLARDPSSVWNENFVGVLMMAFFLVFVALMFIGAVVSVILLALYWRAPLCRAQQPLSSRDWCRILFVNPALWIFGCVVLMLFLL